MRRLTIVAALAAATLSGVARTGEKTGKGKLLVRDGDVIVTCGDSITCGKYPGYIAVYLIACEGMTNIRVKNCAMFGKNTPYLLEHMDSHVLWCKPTVATICMGMNGPGKGATLIGPKAAAIKAELTKATETVIDRFKASGVRTIVLGSSSPTDTDTMRNRKPTNEDSPRAIGCNKSLAVLRDTYRAVAKKKGVLWADVFDDFTAAMGRAKKKYGRTYHVAGPDGVHPRANGQLCIAYSFLKALGCDGHIGTITVDLAGGTVMASKGHKILSAKGGVVEVESSRYPFCFFPDKKGGLNAPETPASIVGSLPFNRDLNRFMLVVKGGKGKKLRVTWGTESREFSADELEKGVNLADAFMKKNPFHAPFAYVSIRSYWWGHSFSKLKRVVDKWDKKSAKTEGHIGFEKRLARSEEVLKAARKPVRHTIRVSAAE
jgi:lysophospholipase L1-like esterase